MEEDTAAVSLTALVTIASRIPLVWFASVLPVDLWYLPLMSVYSMSLRIFCMVAAVWNCSSDVGFSVCPALFTPES